MFLYPHVLGIPTPGIPATPGAPGIHTLDIPGVPGIPGVSTPGIPGIHTLNIPSTLDIPGIPTPGIPESSGPPKFPNNPNFRNKKVVLDTSVLIAYSKRPEEILSKVGGRPIHHVKVIREEMIKFFMGKFNCTREDSSNIADSILNKFNSSILPETAFAKALEGVMTQYLLFAKIPPEQLEAEKNDITIMSQATDNKADIVSLDRLFYVMGKMFKTKISVIHLGKPADGWFKHVNNALRKGGIKPKIKLLRIVRRRKFS